MEPDIALLVGLGVVLALIAVVLRQHRPEAAMMVTLAGGIYIMFRIMGYLLPIVEQTNSILQTTGVNPEYAGILFKALGICFLTQIACDACRDAGETAIAAKIEMAGRVGVLAVSLPLFTQVLSVVLALLQ